MRPTGWRPMCSEKELIGTWHLVSMYHLDKNGAIHDGPLGADVDGILMYDPQGYMSVSLMRVGERADNDSQPTTYMGYAGRWRLSDHHVIHEVAVGSDSRIVHTAQVREVEAAGNRLVLRERLDESPRYLVLTWQRAGE